MRSCHRGSSDAESKIMIVFVVFAACDFRRVLRGLLGRQF